MNTPEQIAAERKSRFVALPDYASPELKAFTDAFNAECDASTAELLKAMDSVETAKTALANLAGDPATLIRAGQDAQARVQALHVERARLLPKLKAILAAWLADNAEEAPKRMKQIEDRKQHLRAVLEREGLEPTTPIGLGCPFLRNAIGFLNLPQPNKNRWQKWALEIAALATTAAGVDIPAPNLDAVRAQKIVPA